MKLITESYCMIVSPLILVHYTDITVIAMCSPIRMCHALITNALNIIFQPYIITVYKETDIDVPSHP